MKISLMFLAIKNFIAYNTLLLFSIVSLFVLALLWSYRNILLSKTDDILVEIVGFFLDIVLFGIILTIYDKWRGKRQKIREYYNQLRAFRTWRGEEGVLRKVGIIRQLTEEMKVPLPEMKDINLNKADLSQANLSGANLSGANLSSAHLSKANLSSANLSSAILPEAELIWANLSGANLSGAMLYRAELSDADLLDANLSRANLTEAIHLTAERLIEVATLYKVKGLDQELRKQLEAEAPQLFEKPDWYIESDEDD